MDNPPKQASPSTIDRITQLGDDLLHNILSKLPAPSFAIAACVNRTWNGVCSHILSRPLLSSAISLNPSLPEAVKEVLGKVLSGPIQPHFVICACQDFALIEAHRLITEKLGTSIPVITCEAAGIIGRDALTDHFSEVKFPYEEDHGGPAEFAGISLTVGCVPGLKVDAIPLLVEDEGACIDEFVMEIRNFSAFVSGCTSPEAIIMFGDAEADMMPVLGKLDYAFRKQTIIAGNEGCHFKCSSHLNCVCMNEIGTPPPSSDAVALVFSRDRSKLSGLGKIEFHFSLGAGLSALGPTYKVASAKMRTSASSTWLTAKRQGENEALDGQQMLSDIDMEDMESDLYIGVTKRRKCSIGSERKIKSVRCMAYHPVHDADEEYLYVRGGDIKTGDPFRFYVPDPELALSLCPSVSENIRHLKHKEIIGGFIFTCCGRGLPFFDKPNVDSSPILDNFPCAPLTGMFCGGEIGRGPHSDEYREQDCPNSYLHAYSSVYLLISYTPP